MKVTSCCYQKSYKIIDKVKICTNPVCKNYLGITKVIHQFSFGLIGYGVLIGILMFFPYNQGESQYTANIFPVYSMSVQKPIPDLTFENVNEEVDKLEMICPEQVKAQIKLESGNLKSDLLKRTNNMLGMRFPYRRNTTAVGIFIPSKDTIVYGTQKELLVYKHDLSYAVYANWVDCIKDYKLWQEQTFNVQKRYIEFLKKNYAEDTLYVKKLFVLSEKANS